MPGLIRTNNGWKNLSQLVIRTNNGWKNIFSAYLKTSSGWKVFFGKSGPYTTKSPYFSTDTAGNTQWNQVILYGSTLYGQRGNWNANGGTISSYTYKLEGVDSVTIGQGTITSIIAETSMGATYVPITFNTASYDGKWMIFTVKATRTDDLSGLDSTDNTDPGSLGYRLKVIKNNPSSITNTQLIVNSVTGNTIKPKVGDLLQIFPGWNTASNSSIDNTRTITKWYKSTSFPTLITSLQSSGGGYYQTSGATLLSTSSAYTVLTSDNNFYIFANQEVFNSGTDYNVGVGEGKGITTGAAFTQQVGSPYSFAFYNILYSSTNGSVGLDSGLRSPGLPTSGRHVFVYGRDLVNISTKHWSNTTDYYIQYDAYQFGQSPGTGYSIKYQIKFSTSHPTYALIKIINKGVNLPQPTYIGYYEGSTLLGVVSGPFTLFTGSIYRINFNATAGTTTGQTFTEIPDAAFVLDSSIADDDTFYTLITDTREYSLPTITFNSPTATGSSLSFTVASTGNDFSFYNYIVRSGSHSGPQVSSGLNQTGTLSITGLSGATTYYIEVNPYNSQIQNGAGMFFTGTTATVLGTPTITFSNVTFNSFSLSWSATNATSYRVDIYETISGNQVSGYPTTTALTSTLVSNLQSNRGYSVSIYGINNGVNGPTQTNSTSTLLGPVLTPTFGVNTSTVGGFNGSVTNYDANYTWYIYVSVGSVSWGTPSGSTRPFTVSGLSSNQSSTVTVTTSRNDYTSGSASTTGTASLVQYTVTWNANGGTGGGSTTQNAGVAHTATSPGTRSGYTFNGYYDAPSGDFLYGPIASGGFFNPPSSINMYARWTLIVVTPNVTAITATGYNSSTAPYINFTFTSNDAASLSIMLYRSATSSTGPWTALVSRLIQSTTGTASVNFSSRTGTSNNWYYVDVVPYTNTNGTGTAGTLRTSRVKSAGSTTTTTVYP
jgi:hypothetical protein